MFVHWSLLRVAIAAASVDSTHDEFELQRPPELPAKIPA
jgi:hypothetical protein